MGFKFKTRDLVERLVSAYAMYEGKPYRLHVNRDYVVMGVAIGSSETMAREIDIMSPKFSVADIMGGMCNDDDKVAFLQGNCQDYSGSAVGAWRAAWKSDHSFRTPIDRSKELYNCIMGIHPTFKEAVETVTTKGKKACSFHRNYALVRVPGYYDIDVVYKTRVVGQYDPIKKKFNLRQSPVLTLIKRQLENIAKDR